MRINFKLLLLLITPIFSALAQGPIGLPQVTSYNSAQYKAGTQNWGVVQGKRGILYFANNEGLLTYNGAYWNLYPLPNKTTLRSLATADDGKIYVGGQDEMGYFYPNESGVLTYHSLKDLIPAKEKQFADIWDIYVFNNEVFFRTVNKIFRLKNSKIAVDGTRNAWVHLGVTNNEMFAQENLIGLKVFKNGKWEVRCDDARILTATITSILPYQGDTLLITTLKNGLFLLTGKQLLKKEFVNDKLFGSERINRAIPINKDLYALGTTSSALLIIDRSGKIVQQFSYDEGINNNNIRSIFLDQHQNLWLGLDDGIFFIAFNSAIKHIYPDRKKQVSSYATKIFEGKLYIGTSNGLLAAPINLNQSDFSNSKATFSEVGNTKGQVWGLTTLNNHLLLANEDGGFVINNLEAKQLYNGIGTWLFAPLQKNGTTENVVAGTYTGLQLIKQNDGKFNNAGFLSAMNEPLRFIVVDQKLNCIWASHPYRGIYKFDLSSDGQKIVKTTLLTKNDGLPLTLYNYVFSVKGRTVATTADGIYEYDSKKKQFYQSSFFRPMFKNLPIQFLNEDSDGKIWFASEKKIGVVDFKKQNGKQNFTLVEFPELTNKILAGFESIYPYNDGNIFVGANKGLIHIDYRKYVANLHKPTVLLSKVVLIGKKDSVFFGGYPSAHAAKDRRISPDYSAIHFEYSSTLFEQRENIEFSYKLEGYDEEWSIWSNKSEKDYTNLTHGKYKFLVKARNNLRNESTVASYSFRISPAWYNSTVAYVFYFLVFGGCLYLLVKLQEKEHARQKEKLNQKHQLEIERNEQQITKLQKKQLEAAVEFKNKELATTTMHLVQRGKLLSKIGDELVPLVQQTTSKDTANDLKKVIRLLNEAKKLDNDWNQFAVHFDNVHANFLTNLKEKHQNLSPSDLKLCAYLKLNLSSKEIAQLLNITARAVEVSRYRLRKKLGLTPEINLFDFLLKSATKVN